MKPVPFSGLKLDIVKGGETDDYPKPGNIVTVHYVAYLMMDDDGLPHDETKEKMPGPVFDSTYARDKPFKFKLGAEQVIEGLDKAVQQLSIGERAKISIGPELAYGREGFPFLVPPSCALVYDLKLIDFER
jgi:FK506-binding protein 1